MNKSILATVLMLTIVGCEEPIPGTDGPSIGGPVLEKDGETIVKSRAVLRMNSTGPTELSIENAAANRLSVDANDVRLPSLERTVLDSGTLHLLDLHDEHLNVCGVSGSERCGLAMLRIYTRGGVDVPPVYVGAEGGSLYAVGQGREGAVVVQAVWLEGKSRFTLNDLESADFRLLVDLTAHHGDHVELVMEYTLTR
jgi:hypothetical protein